MSAQSTAIPFWKLLFKNARIFLMGSDDFPAEARVAAAVDLNHLLQEGWSRLAIDRTFPLEEIAAAHEHAERKRGPGRVVLTL